MPRWDCWCGAKGVAGAFCPWCGRRNPGTPPPDLPPAFESAPERDPYELPPPAPMAGPENVETHGAHEPEGPRVGLTPVTRALGAVLTALLVLGAVAVERRSPDPVPTTVAAEPSPSPSPSATEDVEDEEDEEEEEIGPAPPPPASLDAAIASATRFVELTRRRPFKEAVDVRLLPPAEFRKELLAGSDEVEEPDGFSDTLKGLRLADPDEDVEDEEEDLVGDSVVGFYDDDTDRLVVRGGRVDWYVQMVLVHELVHAWQDQHFDLDGLWEGADTMDEALALRALVEGDAQWVENQWLQEQPGGVQEEIQESEEPPLGIDPGDSRARQTLGLLYGFPYFLGEEFVAELVDDGGLAALDRAYSRPPRTTTEIFDAEDYQDGFRAANPPDPKAGGRVLDRGTLGHLGLLVFFFQNTTDPSVSRTVATWAGDEYVTWRSGGDLCTTVSVVMETAERRDELVEALRKANVRSVANAGPKGATFTSCAKASR